MTMDTGYWNEENTAKAMKLWTDGKSASDIAREMGGISRNAIIGKMHRMGITERGPAAEKPSVPRVERPAPVRQVNKFNSLPRLLPKPAAAPLPAPVVHAVPHAGAPDVERLKLYQLKDNQCRWPVSGEKEHMLFCAGSTAPVDVYCKYHARLAYSPRVDRTIRKASTL
jgi:GcrA cell cycle regulator